MFLLYTVLYTIGVLFTADLLWKVCTPAFFILTHFYYKN